MIQYNPSVSCNIIKDMKINDIVAAFCQVKTIGRYIEEYVEHMCYIKPWENSSLLKLIGRYQSY